MDKSYVLIYDHVMTTKALLRSRQSKLQTDLNSGIHVDQELKRVGGLLKSLSRLERDMIYWFDPQAITQRELPFALEKDYYDDAKVPKAKRFLK